jgi:hypothetical protein
MVGRQSKQELLAKGEVVAAPAHSACTDQTFELPIGLYAAMAVFFSGFVGVLAAVFHGGHLAVAFAVIFAFIAAYFSIPWIFPGMASDSRNKAMSWDEFSDRGIVTATGHSTAREATILVLLLPALIFCFGLAIAILWALS